MPLFAVRKLPRRIGVLLVALSAALVTITDSALLYSVVGDVVIDMNTPHDTVKDVGVNVLKALVQVGGADVFFLSIVGIPHDTSPIAPWIRTTFTYCFLPIGNNGADICKRLFAAGTPGGLGQTAFRKIIGWENKLFDPTTSLSNAEWTIDFGSCSFGTRDIVIPKDADWGKVPRVDIQNESSSNGGSPGGITTTQIPNGDITVIDPPPPPKVPYTKDQLCRQLSTGPCVCASGTDCTWDDIALVCRAKSLLDVEGVSCDDCKTQPTCPFAICRQNFDPCECYLQANNGCAWWDAQQMCVVDLTHSGTSCKGCARQSQCRPPSATGFNPAAGIWFQRLASYGTDAATSWYYVSVVFSVPIFLCKGSPRSTRVVCPAANVIMYLPPDQVQVANSKLTARFYARPSVNWDCYLDVPERGVCDGDDVPFLGLTAGAYAFTIVDAVDPTVSSFFPSPGSDFDGTIVSLTFSEDVSLIAGYSAELRLNGEQTAFFPWKTIALQPPFASMPDKRTIKIDLSGQLVAGNLYSLSLPNGSFTDKWGNRFTGLAPGAFTFRLPDEASSTSDKTDEGARLVVVIVAVVCAVFGGCLCVSACVLLRLYVLYMRGELKNKLKESETGRGRMVKSWDLLRSWSGTVEDDERRNRIKNKVAMKKVHPEPSDDTVSGTSNEHSRRPSMTSTQGLPGQLNNTNQHRLSRLSGTSDGSPPLDSSHRPAASPRRISNGPGSPPLDSSNRPAASPRRISNAPGSSALPTNRPAASPRPGRLGPGR